MYIKLIASTLSTNAAALDTVFTFSDHYRLPGAVCNCSLRRVLPALTAACISSRQATNWVKLKFTADRKVCGPVAILWYVMHSK